jgi:hypothetical protein
MLKWHWCAPWCATLFLSLAPFEMPAQIDPFKRDLIQIGYNGALEGHQPLSLYAFYYRNQPEFLRTNWTLRLALAPTYLDSELGMARSLGPNTDLGIGLAGGGFADNYVEIDQGTYIPSQSFNGFGGSFSSSIYHLFNPGARIPLNGIVRGIAQYSTYAPSDKTASNFQVPSDRNTYYVRTGLRWGGREPTLYPSLAMEVSAWYEGQFRSDWGPYGYDGDREVNQQSQTFWGRASLTYTTPGSRQSFEAGLTAGSSLSADRFSAYRLGALLPLVSEYPLSIPGYYYQELSARQFALLSVNYLLPLDSRQRWNLDFTGAGAWVDYLPGLEQPGNWHGGVGAGILYTTKSWKVMVGYSYGIRAIRSDGPGAQSIGVLMQLDWGEAKNELFNPTTPSLWRGVQRVFGLFGN